MRGLHMPTFFAYVRRSPFGGRLSQSQVDGLNATLDMWEVMGDGDDRKLAYILATEFAETGGRMQPVRETFGRNDDEVVARLEAHRRKTGKPSKVYWHAAGPNGQRYYGRGSVQLTWRQNYETMGRLLGVDLVNKPDLALDPVISKKILIEGMMRGKSGRGDFTGKALEDYFNDRIEDPVNARRIVNGTDSAKLIATYYQAFKDSIRAAREAHAGQRVPEDEVPAPTSVPPTDSVTVGGVLAGLGGAVSTILGFLGQIDNPYALAATLAIVGLGAYLVISGRLRLLREAGL